MQLLESCRHALRIGALFPAQLWFRAESLRSVFAVGAARQAKCAVSLSFDYIMIISGQGLAVQWRCGVSDALLAGKQILTCEKCLVYLRQLRWLHTRQADMAGVHQSIVAAATNVGTNTVLRCLLCGLILASIHNPSSILSSQICLQVFL